MKKLFPLLFLFVIVALPLLTLAAAGDPPAGLRLPDDPLNNPTDALRVVYRIANWIFTFLLILAVIFILIAAFNYLTASGDDTKIKKAHKMIWYAVIAVAVGILSQGIVVVVSKLVSNEGVNFNSIR